jgi:alkanesulfonate monooxygenase SsuD/methylene tetrahydromethanopterin reductase-like flavin-dependent oxidoreductase (luciferase family)
MVILQPDPERAREIARGPVSFMNKGPGYATNFRRMGFSEDEVTGLSDRLVDAVTAWGDVEAVAARIAEQLEAGADQVVLSVNAQSPDSVPVGQLRQLAEALIP